MKAAVFIDKDGTLIDDVPYNADPALLVFAAGALDALRVLDAAGLALVVVTNQSGIALGRFSRAQFARLQSALEARLREEAGIRLAGFLLCPHAPAPSGEPACLCRKPAPGMLLRAAREQGIDLARSWMVGDTLDDVEAGRRAGCRAVLLDSGGETVWRRSPMRTPQHQFSRWDEVAQAIVAAMPGNAPSSATSTGTTPAGTRPISSTPADSAPADSMPAGTKPTGTLPADRCGAAAAAT